MDSEPLLDEKQQSSPYERSKRRSPVYNYFDTVAAKENEPLRKFMQCRQCSMKITAVSTNLEKHLRSTHKAEYEQFLLVKASRSTTRADQRQEVKEESLDTEGLANADDQSKEIKLEVKENRANKLGDKVYSSPYDKNKRRSPIYNFFTTSEDPNRMQCHYCSSKITTKPTNLEKHLRTNHPMEYEGFRILKESASSTTFASVKRKAESDLESDQQESCEAEEFVDGDGRAIKLEAEEFRVISQDNLEFIGVSGKPPHSQRLHSSENGHLASKSELHNEEKFIKAVFPEFAGKTKLELIDEIRLLRDKNRVYKDTIDKFLDN